MDREQTLKQLTKKELIGLLEDAAKNWLAHDGLWFQAVERKYGQETAIALDAEAWRSFTVIEAKRIMKRLGIEEGGGLAPSRKPSVSASTLTSTSRRSSSSTRNVLSSA